MSALNSLGFFHSGTDRVFSSLVLCRLSARSKSLDWANRRITVWDYDGRVLFAYLNGTATL